MSYARYPTVQVDRLAIILVGLLVSFQVLALQMVNQVLTADPPAQQSSPSLGIEIFLLAMVEVGIIILVWRGYKRLSETWQTRVKATLGGLWIGVATWIAYQFGQLPLFVAGTLVTYVLLKTVSFGNKKWLAFNIMAFGFGVVVVTLIGVQIAPVVVLVLMVLFMAYDYVAVDLSSIMGDLVEFSGSVTLPNFIVIPNGWNVDFDGVTDFLQGGERPDNLAFLIGLGDFIFPAALTVSVAVQLESTTALPVLGAVIGTGIAGLILRGAAANRDSGLPALPYLNTGAMAGFAVGVLVAGTSVMQVVGL